MSACVPFTGTVTPQGYGQVWHDGRTWSAHTLAWTAANGPVPNGMVLDHTCHNTSGCSAGDDCMHRRCVNVAHLEPVPQWQNLRRSPNTIASRNAAKTHCPWGHAYTEANIIPHPQKSGRPGRLCRECKRLRRAGVHPRQLMAAAGESA